MIVARKTLVTLLIAMGMAGCASGPTADTDGLDARLAWPCDRLTLTWPTRATQLQTLVGIDLAPGIRGRVGELRLSILRCEPAPSSRANASPLLYATVSVPLSADSVPLVITSVPDDGWFAMSHIIADANNNSLFADLGYDVLLADISFERDALGSQLAVKIQLQLDGGSIAIGGDIAGERAAHETSTALLTSSDDSLLAFFGQETAERHLATSVDVQIDGDTPLSALEGPAKVPVALFDASLRSDRIFWRLPVSRPQ